MPVYREIATNAPDYEPLPFYSSEFDAEQMAQYLRESIAGGDDEALAPTAGLLTGGVATAGALSAVPDAGADGVNAEIEAPLEGTGTEQ